MTGEKIKTIREKRLLTGGNDEAAFAALLHGWDALFADKWGQHLGNLMNMPCAWCVCQLMQWIAEQEWQESCAPYLSAKDAHVPASDHLADTNLRIEYHRVKFSSEFGCVVNCIMSVAQRAAWLP